MVRYSKVRTREKQKWKTGEPLHCLCRDNQRDNQIVLNRKLAGSLPDEKSTREHLPQQSYDVMKDKAIKRLLEADGLFSGGGRESCIARHRQ